MLFVRLIYFENRLNIKKKSDTILHFFFTLFNAYKLEFSGLLLSCCTSSVLMRKFWEYKKSPLCPSNYCYNNVLIFLSLYAKLNDP